MSADKILKLGLYSADFTLKELQCLDHFNQVTIYSQSYMKSYDIVPRIKTNTTIHTLVMCDELDVELIKEIYDMLLENEYIRNLHLRLYFDFVDHKFLIEGLADVLSVNKSLEKVTIDIMTEYYCVPVSKDIVDMFLTGVCCDERIEEMSLYWTTTPQDKKRIIQTILSPTSRVRCLDFDMDAITHTVKDLDVIETYTHLRTNAVLEELEMSDCFDFDGIRTFIEILSDNDHLTKIELCISEGVHDSDVCDAVLELLDRNGSLCSFIILNVEWNNILDDDPRIDAKLQRNRHNASVRKNSLFEMILGTIGCV